MDTPPTNASSSAGSGSNTCPASVPNTSTTKPTNNDPTGTPRAAPAVSAPTPAPFRALNAANTPQVPPGATPTTQAPIPGGSRVRKATTADLLLKLPKIKKPRNQSSKCWDTVKLLNDEDPRRIKKATATHYCSLCEKLIKSPWNAARKGLASGSYTSSGAISHLKTCKSPGAAAALEVCNITQEQQVAVKTEKHMNLVEKLERFNSFIAEDTTISTPGKRQSRLPLQISYEDKALCHQMRWFTYSPMSPSIRVFTVED